MFPYLDNKFQKTNEQPVYMYVRTSTSQTK